MYLEPLESDSLSLSATQIERATGDLDNNRLIWHQFSAHNLPCRKGESGRMSFKGMGDVREMRGLFENNRVLC
jgi:hypothetical protein